MKTRTGIIIIAAFSFVLLAFVVLIVVTSAASMLEPVYRLHDRKILSYGVEGSDSSFLVMQDAAGKYGYCDTSGKILIKPQFDDARPFFEGYATIRKSRWWGYIDKTGKIVIPCKYMEALEFHNGKALVNVGTSRVDCRVIDENGNCLAKKDYYKIGDFSEGLAPVQLDNVHGRPTDTEEYGYVDVNYNLAFMTKFDPIQPDTTFSEGMAVMQTDNNEYCYVDKTGKIVIAGPFLSALPFSGELAAVEDPNSRLWGYINKSGSYVIEPKYNMASSFGDGIAIVEDTKNILLNKNNYEYIEQYNWITKNLNLYNGYIIDRYYNRLCAAGEIISQPSINRNTWKYSWGYIDKFGTFVIKQQFDAASPFKNGVAEVLIQGRIGYIDSAGNYIWEPK